MRDRVARSGDVGRNDGLPARHRFQKHRAKGLRKRRQDEGRAPGEPLDVGIALGPTHEHDAVGDAALPGERLDAQPLGPIATDDESPAVVLPADEREGLDENVCALDGKELRAREEVGRLFLALGAERIDVDGGREEIDPGNAALREIDRNALAVRRHDLRASHLALLQALLHVEEEEIHRVVAIRESTVRCERVLVVRRIDLGKGQTACRERDPLLAQVDNVRWVLAQPPGSATTHAELRKDVPVALARNVHDTRIGTAIRAVPGKDADLVTLGGEAVREEPDLVLDPTARRIAVEPRVARAHKGDLHARAMEGSRRYAFRRSAHRNSELWLATPMRVVHVTPTFFDARRSLVGGGERFVSELARAMARKADVTILTFGLEDETLREDGVEIRIRRPLARGKNPLNPFPGRLPELREADVVHVHQPFTFLGSRAILAARRREQKVFLTDLGGGGFNVHARLRLDRFVAGYLCISEYSASLLASHDAPKEVIYAGVDPERFRPLGLPRERKVVCVGRIMPHKGQADVVRALPDDVDLEVLGPVLDPDYAALTRRLAEGKRVRFVHDASTDDIARAYNTAALTVQASVHHTEFGGYSASTELFGLTLAESMACETPVIATRAGSLPEVPVEGETGLVVPPREPDAMRDAMRAILDDPERARAMGKRGRARVLERFTWDAVARRCFDAYERLPRRP